MRFLWRTYVRDPVRFLAAHEFFSGAGVNEREIKRNRQLPDEQKNRLCIWMGRRRVCESRSVFYQAAKLEIEQDIHSKGELAVLISEELDRSVEVRPVPAHFRSNCAPVGRLPVDAQRDVEDVVLGFVVHL